jgi:hypothetical protein
MCQIITCQVYGVTNFLLQHEGLQQNATFLSEAFEFYWESIAKK